jgi:hypothetical protein
LYTAKEDLNALVLLSTDAADVEPTDAEEDAVAVGEAVAGRGAA